jgi:hypothetical protein
MIRPGMRIDWKVTIPFLMVIWAVCSIDQSWMVAAIWTAIVIGFDLILNILNRFHKENKDEESSLYQIQHDLENIICIPLDEEEVEKVIEYFEKLHSDKEKEK